MYYSINRANRWVISRTDAKFAVLSFFVVIISIISMIYTFNYTKIQEFNNLFSLPLIYTVCYLLFFAPILRNRFKIVVCVYATLSFLRYVVLPFMMVYTQTYYALSYYLPVQYISNEAIYLMNYELFCCSAFFMFICNKYKTNTSNSLSQPDKLATSQNFVMWVFIVMCIVLLFAFPGTLNDASFIQPRQYVNSFGEATPDKLIQFLVNIGRQLLFVLITFSCSTRYRCTRNKMYVFIALLLAFINISVYFGTSRTAILMPAISTVLMMRMLFYRERRFITWTVIGAVAAILIIVTQFRNSNIGTGNNISEILFRFATFQDAYYGGPFNVSIAITTTDLYRSIYVGVNTFIAEFIRLALGLSLLYKNTSIMTSDILFNLTFTQGSSTVGQIIPIIGQGYYYLGFFGAPFIVFPFFYIAIRLENLIYKTDSPAIVYFSCITAARVGSIMGQNTMLQVSSMTATLIIPFILVWLNRRIVLTRSK